MEGDEVVSKETRMRRKLRELQTEGHSYLELRTAGSGWVYFCAPCLGVCHTRKCLDSHLTSKWHRRRVNYLSQNIWPGLRDDVFLFNADLDLYNAAADDATNQVLDIQDVVSNNDGAASELGVVPSRGERVISGVVSNDGDAVSQSDVVERDDDGQLLVISGVVSNDGDAVSQSDVVERDDDGQSLVISGVVSNDGDAVSQSDVVPKDDDPLWRFIAWNYDEWYDQSRHLPWYHDKACQSGLVAWDCEDDDCSSAIPCVVLKDDEGTSKSGEVVASGGDDRSIVIPTVLQSNGAGDIETRDLNAKKIGLLKVVARSNENKIRRIWCEWLGDGDITNEDLYEHDFGVVVFSYTHMLAKIVSEHVQTWDSDSESSEEEPQSSHVEDRLIEIEVHMKNAKNASKNKIDLYKWIKSERKQLGNGEYQSCGICLQKLVYFKDAATLLNRRTGKLACSSRHWDIFELFHVSCLIQWLLLFEVDDLEKKLVDPEGKHMSETQDGDKRLWSSYCPQCQGSGFREFEDPLRIPSSEIWDKKIRLVKARKEWIRSPEWLQKCPMGLTFRLGSSNTDEDTVKDLKFLSIYRAHGY